MYEESGLMMYFLDSWFDAWFMGMSFSMTKKTWKNHPQGTFGMAARHTWKDNPELATAEDESSGTSWPASTSRFGRHPGRKDSKMVWQQGIFSRWNDITVWIFYFQYVEHHRLKCISIVGIRVYIRMYVNDCQRMPTIPYQGGCRNISSPNCEPHGTLFMLKLSLITKQTQPGRSGSGDNWSWTKTGWFWASGVMKNNTTSYTVRDAHSSERFRLQQVLLKLLQLLLRWYVYIYIIMYIYILQCVHI